MAIKYLLKSNKIKIHEAIDLSVRSVIISNNVNKGQSSLEWWDESSKGKIKQFIYILFIYINIERIDLIRIV